MSYSFPFQRTSHSKAHGNGSTGRKTQIAKPKSHSFPSDRSLEQLCRQLGVGLMLQAEKKKKKRWLRVLLMAWQIVQRRKEIANKFTEALPASCAPGSAWHPATLARRQMKANKQQHVLAHSAVPLRIVQGPKVSAALTSDSLEQKQCWSAWLSELIAH